MQTLNLILDLIQKDNNINKTFKKGVKKNV